MIFNKAHCNFTFMYNVLKIIEMTGLFIRKGKTLPRLTQLRKQCENFY